MSKRVFISKDLDQNSPILSWSNQMKIHLVGQAFIHIKHLKFSPIVSDWIFFSSKNGVRGFMSNQIKLDYKFGVIGKSTELELKKYTDNIDFVGEGNETSRIAEEFYNQTKNDQVCFASSNLSLNQMAKPFKKMNSQVVQVYETILTNGILDEQFDVYVFTSPSNVNSFLSRNSIPIEAKIIAIGNSTKNQLRKYFPKRPIDIPIEFNEYAILEVIKKHCKA